MKTQRFRFQIILLLVGLLFGFSATAEEQNVRPGINRHYEDADWQQWVNTFERAGREVYDRRDAIVAASNVRPGMDVADIGAGTGLFTRLFAPAVAPGGIVYAVDITKNFIDGILRSSREQGLSNVKGIVNSQTDVGLPADSIDLVFITATYHHFEYPKQTMASVHQALRDEGRVIIVDYRRDPHISSDWVMSHVRGNKDQVVMELEEAGFQLVDDKPLMKTFYFLEFVKAGDGKKQ